MKTITYNPETHVLVPLTPDEKMIDAGDSIRHGRIKTSIIYMHMLAAAPQPEPVESEPVCEWVKADGANYIRPKWHKDYVAVEGDKLYAAPQPDRTAELEAALKVAREIAIDAATSLETIAIRSYGEDSYLDSKPQMRAFAQARASVAMKKLTRINEMIGE